MLGMAGTCMCRQAEVAAAEAERRGGEEQRRKDEVEVAAQQERARHATLYPAAS